jgi:hypothetical protein
MKPGEDSCHENSVTFTLPGFTTFRRDGLVGAMLALVPGAVSPANGIDTGGTRGEQSVRISVFGDRPGDMRQMTNGMLYSNLNCSTATFIRNTYTAPGAVTSTPWLQPTQVQDGRFWKFSAQYEF